MVFLKSSFSLTEQYGLNLKVSNLNESNSKTAPWHTKHENEVFFFVGELAIIMVSGT